jgi:hypothetical protein
MWMGDGDNGLPGFGGEGHGPLVEQPERLDKTLSNPQPTPSQENITPYSSPNEEQAPEDEEEEEETESERYWRMNPVRKRNNNEVYYPGRHQEDDD